MLNAVTNLLKIKLSELPFLEVIGGIVQPIDKVEEKYDNNNNVVGYTSTTFPISCGMSNDCFDSGRYMALVPDDSKRSVGYFEQIGGVKPIGTTGPKNNIVCYEGRLRFVCWLNLQRLGLVDNCTYAPQFVINTICNIEGGCRFDNSVFPESHFTVEVIEEPKRDASIFKDYSYDRNRLQFLLFPFDYFAIDLRIKMYISKGCLEPIVLGEPIECNII